MIKNTLPTCECCAEHQAVINDGGYCLCRICYRGHIGPGADEDIRTYWVIMQQTPEPDLEAQIDANVKPI